MEEWDVEATWNNDGDDAEDVKDESAAYLEFLKEEVSLIPNLVIDETEGQ